MIFARGSCRAAANASRSLSTLRGRDLLSVNLSPATAGPALSVNSLPARALIGHSSGGSVMELGPVEPSGLTWQRGSSSPLADPTKFELDLAGPPTLDLLPFDLDPDFAGLSLELRVLLRDAVDQLVAENPDVVFKLGSCYLRRFPARPNDQAQYNREYFDNGNAKLLLSGFVDDSTGAAAEGYAIEFAKYLSKCVNARRVRPGSFPRNRKRGDVGFTWLDSGCIYAVPTRYSSKEEFDANHVSYYHKRKAAAARKAA